jgi:hypothetical protein
MVIAPVTGTVKTMEVVFKQDCDESPVIVVEHVRFAEDEHRP